MEWSKVHNTVVKDLGTHCWISIRKTHVFLLRYVFQATPMHHANHRQTVQNQLQPVRQFGDERHVGSLRAWFATQQWREVNYSPGFCWKSLPIHPYQKKVFVTPLDNSKTHDTLVINDFWLNNFYIHLTKLFLGHCNYFYIIIINRCFLLWHIWPVIVGKPQVCCN